MLFFEIKKNPKLFFDPFLNVYGVIVFDNCGRD